MVSAVGEEAGELQCGEAITGDLSDWERAEAVRRESAVEGGLRVVARARP
jgi:hypothetical protein